MAIKIRLRGVKEEFNKLDKETTQTVNELARIQAFDTMNKLKMATPIDTGRAKNSWTLTMNKNSFKDAKSGGSFVTTLPAVSDSKIETLYLTNGTPYIENLNQGSSRQAPARFIESTILSSNYNIDGVLFETINMGSESDKD
jgi:hypothetical protein